MSMSCIQVSKGNRIPVWLGFAPDLKLKTPFSGEAHYSVTKGLDDEKRLVELVQVDLPK